jgi:hypothetical protein
MLSASSPLHRLTRRSCAIVASAALATCLAATFTAGATAATTTVPAGGNFEATPLLYTTSGTAGALAEVKSSQAAEADGNHYLHTLYSTLLGVIGTNSATATITSPSFEYDQATPSAVAFSFERRSSLSGVLGANVAIAWSARLVNQSSGATTMLSSQTITTSEALHTISVPVAPTTLIAGDTYHLAIAEEFSSLLGLIQSSSVDLDNVGLNVTAGLTPPVLGAIALGTTSEHGVTATTTIDPNGEASTYGLQYGTSAAYGSTGPLEAIPAGSSGSRQASSTLTGLAPGTLYHVRFIATDEDGTSYGPETTFTTAAATPPSIASAQVEDLTTNAATVSAVVDPGNSSTSVEVLYGTTIAYGRHTAPQTLAAGAGAMTVRIPISSLSPGTPYYAKLVATNADGVRESTGLIFLTDIIEPPPPAGAAIGATSLGAVAEREATLLSTIDPQGAAATYSVQYGPSILYGSSTPTQTIASGTTGPQEADVDVTGLTPGTTYHARYVAISAGVTTYGPDTVFTTAAAIPPKIGEADVAELTKTAATVHATVDPGASTTTLEVLYGPTTAYGQHTATQTLTANAGASAVQLPISALFPGTTYHAKLVASNLDGTVETADLTFQTKSEETVTPTPPGGGEKTPPGGGTSGGGTGGETGNGTAGGGSTLGSGSAGGTTSGNAIGTSSGTTGSSTTAGSTTAGTGSSTSGAGTPTGDVGCLRVETVRRGRAVRYLSTPASAEVSAGHPLRIALTARAGHPRAVRYSLGGASLASARRARSVLIAASQLRAGHKTVLRIVVSPAKGSARSLRVTITATACGR